MPKTNEDHAREAREWQERCIRKGLEIVTLLGYSFWIENTKWESADTIGIDVVRELGERDLNWEKACGELAKVGLKYHGLRGAALFVCGILKGVGRRIDDLQLRAQLMNGWNELARALHLEGNFDEEESDEGPGRGPDGP